MICCCWAFFFCCCFKFQNQGNFVHFMYKMTLVDSYGPRLFLLGGFSDFFCYLQKWVDIMKLHFDFDRNLFPAQTRLLSHMMIRFSCLSDLWETRVSPLLLTTDSKYQFTSKEICQSHRHGHCNISTMTPPCSVKLWFYNSNNMPVLVENR